jgi:hypothetical protein
MITSGDLMDNDDDGVAVSGYILEIRLLLYAQAPELHGD